MSPEATEFGEITQRLVLVISSIQGVHSKSPWGCAYNLPLPILGPNIFSRPGGAPRPLHTLATSMLIASPVALLVRAQYTPLIRAGEVC